MPPLRLTSLLHAALPELSSASRAVLSTLGCLNGNAPSARDMAAWVGLRDRYQLARALRRDGLPPLEHLAGWTRVMYWLLEAESSGASLRQLAQRAGLTVALLRLREHRGMRIFGARTTTVEVRHHLAEAVGDDVVSSTAPVAPPRPLPPAAPWRGPQALPSHRTRHPSGVLADRCVIGGSPFDVAITPDGVALVTRLHAAAIDTIRLQPLRCMGSVHTGPAPTRIVLSPPGSCAYVTNQFAEEIGIIDLDTLEQTATIPVPGHPLGAALAPDGRTLFVTTNLDRLCAVSLSARRVVTSVPIPGVCPGIVMHPSGCRVYVPCWKAGVILETDARTLCQLRRFDVGGTAQEPVVSSDGLTLDR